MIRIMFLCDLGSPWQVTLVKKFLEVDPDSLIVYPKIINNTSAYISLEKEALTGPLKAAYLKKQVKIVRVENRLLYRVLAAPKAVRTIAAEYRPDIVFSLYGGYLSYLMMQAGNYRKATYFVGSDILLGGFFKTKIYNQLLLRHLDISFFNGKHLLDRVQKYYKKSNMVTSYIGLDVKEFNIESRLGGKNRLYICTRGFTDLYNNDFIINALSHMDLVASGSSFVFTSSGPNLEASIALADQLIDSENRLRIRFLGGVDRSELVDLLSEASIYVSMSKSDGASVSLWEAMLSKCYPVLSNIPANNEWKFGANMLSIDLDDSKFLAKELERSMNSFDEFGDVLEKNRKLVIKKASITRSVNNIRRQIIKRVLT